MARPREIPEDYSAFAGLPVQYVTVGRGGDRVAVHLSGDFGRDRPALVCLPGYQRNMSDYGGLVRQLRARMGVQWPVVLIDLRGRGRSTDRGAEGDYVTTNDARDVGEVLAALALDAPVLLGQGYGGHVIMALSAQRPLMIGGAVLIDAGPAADPHGLVRLRTNLIEMAAAQNEATYRRIARQIMTVDYPEVPEPLLDAAAARTHYLDARKRPKALFDERLVRLLEPYDLDDVLAPQWPLFATLGHVPMLLMRSEFTEQLRLDVFEEMLSRRRDAQGYVIGRQGSPPLLDTPDDVAPIADFLTQIVEWRGAVASVEA
jgi:pimeloyl-ACP methyl ester carboxylesterase